MCSVAHSVLPSLTGGRGDAKERGREKKDVIRCEKRRGEGAARQVRVKREREGDSGWWWWWGGLESELTG